MYGDGQMKQMEANRKKGNMSLNTEKIATVPTLDVHNTKDLKK
jgi:hypothetical protein